MAATSSVDPYAPWGGWSAAYVADADAILALLSQRGLRIEGRRVAVVGAAGGVLALALVERFGAASVVVFDDGGCNTVTLAAVAQEMVGLAELPPTERLSFLQTRPYELPGGPQTFDLGIWWHGVDTVRDAARMLGELARIIAPQGHIIVRAPGGRGGLDELGLSLLAAGLLPLSVTLPSLSIEVSTEDRSARLADLATQGATVLAFRPS